MNETIYQTNTIILLFHAVKKENKNWDRESQLTMRNNAKENL